MSPIIDIINFELLRLNVKSLKLSIEVTTLGRYCVGLQQNLIHLVPSYRLSHWIQMNFYLNPDGPALLSVLLEGFYGLDFGMCMDSVT
jgi:hypothetical protein